MSTYARNHVFLVSMALLAAGCWRSTTVSVEIREGQLTVEPKQVAPANIIRFRVTNAGIVRHSFVVVRTKWAPGNLPVERHHVRRCTRPGGPRLIFYDDHGGHQTGCGPDGGFDPEHATEVDDEGPSGVTVEPGESMTFDQVVQYDAAFESGTRFVAYCDEEGHYEGGEYAGIAVR